MVEMCKGKWKQDYEALMTSSLSDCTCLEKERKFRTKVVFKEYDAQKRYYGLGMECMTRLAIKDKHKDMIIARN
jgi:hypothetical protein